MRESKPSSTALLIARSLLLADREPALRPLLAPDAAAILAPWLDVVSARSRWISRLLQLRVVRRLLLNVERMVLPGILLHYLVRKRCLEETTAAALERGCRQVVILGAGLDTLAWRLHPQWAAAQFIEVDHPVTQRIKSAAFARTKDAGQNFTLLPVDLAQARLTEILSTCPQFEPQRSTIVLAEGLLMYLSFEQVEKLFRELRTLLRAPAELAFTFFEPRNDGTPGFVRSSRIVSRWLRWRGEPFRWAATAPELAALLERCGWVKQQLFRAQDFRQRYLADSPLAMWPLAEGEAICVATKN